MKNTSLASKLTLLYGVFAALVLLTAAAAAVLDGVWAWVAVACGVAMAFGLFLYARRVVESEMRLLPRIDALIGEMRLGEFESRLTGIGAVTEIGAIAWKLNDALDQIETFFREQKTASEYFRNRRYFRSALAQGLHGGFAVFITEANEALLRSQEATETVIARQQYLGEQVERIAEVLYAIVQKNLSRHLVAPYPDDEIGKLIAHVNDTTKGLQHIIKTMGIASGTVAAASEQIAVAMQEMSSTFENQAEQSEQIAAAALEMTQTIRETSSGTFRAALLTEQTVQFASAGQESMAKTVQVMQDIARIVQEAGSVVEQLGNASEQIGTIVQTIEEIADQTNLLALNAAIEAARAGESGRGFAVVADEVRKLAERTQKATKEISRTIKVIQQNTHDAVSASRHGGEQVRSGIMIAEETGKSLSTIVDGIQQVNDIITQIASAAEEEFAVSEDIAARIEALSEASAQSSSVANSITQSSDKLQKQAAGLFHITNEFILDEKLPPHRPQLIESSGRG
ncbi:MAG: methyl-accepting chemotaxis protein [Candidatus Kapaibacteriota bacterium]